MSVRDDGPDRKGTNLGRSTGESVDPDSGEPRGRQRGPPSNKTSRTQIIGQRRNEDRGESGKTTEETT